MYGTYVLREFNGRGIGRALIQAVLDVARATPEIFVVELTVTESNAAALQLYESCGFVRYGLEPFSNRVGEQYISKAYMWCRLDPDAA